MLRVYWLLVLGLSLLWWSQQSETKPNWYFVHALCKYILWDSLRPHVTFSLWLHTAVRERRFVGGSPGPYVGGQESSVMCWTGAGRVRLKQACRCSRSRRKREAFQSEGHTQTAGRGINVCRCEQPVAICTVCVWVCVWVLFLLNVHVHKKDAFTFFCITEITFQ